ncbi:hypothetical protein [Rugosibacter aromaticivorans]|nr:hypothetical protein [Rugosibacter aromaticivorans]
MYAKQEEGCYRARSGIAADSARMAGSVLNFVCKAVDVSLIAA